MQSLNGPHRVRELSLRDPCTGPCPPIGFVGISEHSLGNGDYYGFYWPLACEDREPLVCEFWHETSELIPSYSSLDRFLAKAAEFDTNEWFEMPRLAEDPESPVALLKQAEEDIAQEQLEDAITRLELALKVLPEYSAAWAALAKIFRRQQRVDDALFAVNRALQGPCFFGGRTDDGLIRWYQRQDSNDVRLKDDPLWNRRREMTFKYGGEKRNDDYDHLLACVDEYEATRAGFAAILLYWRYADLMAGETTAFQDRYGYTRSGFIERQERMLAELLDTKRKLTPRVSVETGDLLEQDVDVIVNAWNRNIIPWWLLVPQGVSRAIRKAAGVGPFRELARHGPIPLGEAVLTGAGRLPYKGIIHVAGLNMLWYATEKSIRASIRSAMQIINQHHFSSVAFPLIGAGTGGKEKDRARTLIQEELAALESVAEVIVVEYRDK